MLRSGHDAEMQTISLRDGGQLGSIEGKGEVRVVQLYVNQSIYSHWVSFYAQSPDTVNYFDSYGEAPNQMIDDYLRKNFKKINRNNKPIQSPFSTVCGQFCILMIYLSAVGLKFNSILKLLHNNHNNIDNVVRTFVSNLE